MTMQKKRHKVCKVCGAFSRKSQVCKVCKGKCPYEASAKGGKLFDRVERGNDQQTH